MKKISTSRLKKAACVLFCSISILLCNSSYAQISVTATAGTSTGSYAHMKEVFDAINAGTHQGAIVVTITADLAGTFTATLNSSAYTSVLIQPSGARTWSAHNGGGLMQFNGADNVTIDGLNTGGNSLTIENKALSNPGFVMKFLGDASSNVVQNCTLKTTAQGSLNSNGVSAIYFSTGTITGNDSNTVQNCLFAPSVAGGAAAMCFISAIGSTGSQAIQNSGNTIKNCLFSDCFYVPLPSSAIYIGDGNEEWTITGNRFYQTVTRSVSSTSNLLSTCITLNVASASSTMGNGFSITDNTIGYGDANGAGRYTIKGSTNGNPQFRAIDIKAVGTGTATSVQNNTIAAISLYTGSTGKYNNAICPFIGIYVGEGLVHIGDVTGNTIGSATVPGDSITFSPSNAGGSDFVGIRTDVTSVSTTISNNVIANIQTGTASFCTVVGIYSANIVRANIGTAGHGNIIGSALCPITSNSSGVTLGRIIGILTESGSNTITGNNVNNLVMAGGNVSTGLAASVVGIQQISTLQGQTVSQNVIHSLSNTSMFDNAVTGIYYKGALSGTNIITRNFIHSLSVSEAVDASLAGLTGIEIGGGSSVYSNNMVRLGIDASGNDITVGCRIIGIHAPAVTNTVNKFYYNSIYIGGNSVVPTNVTNHTYALRDANTTAQPRDYRNNILYTARSNSGGAVPKHYAVSLGIVSGTTIDYNDYYVTGTNGGLLGSISGTDTDPFSAWQTGTGQDANSKNVNPPFINTTGNASTVNLHLNVLTPSPIISAAVSGTSVTDDHDTDTRSSSPDLGADETRRIVIAYNPVTDSICLAASSPPTITATITAIINAVDNTSLKKPRLWFKKSSDVNNAVAATNTSANTGWKFVETSSSSSPYSFTFDYTILNGGFVLPGDTIQYFIVAQDDAALPKVTSNSATFAGLIDNVGLTGVTGAAATNIYAISPPPPPFGLTVSNDTVYSSHASSYQWYFNGNPISNSTDSFHVALQYGNYSVVITDAKGCTTLSASVLAGPISVPEFENALAINIYPNPVGDILVISHSSIEISDVTIYNALGEKVYSDLSSKGSLKTVSCKNLSRGIYFIQAAVGGKTVRAKMVKE